MSVGVSVGVGVGVSVSLSVSESVRESVSCGSVVVRGVGVGVGMLRSFCSVLQRISMDSSVLWCVAACCSHSVLLPASC